MTTTMQRPEAAQGPTQPRPRRTKVAVAIGALAVAVTAGALVLMVAADDSALIGTRRLPSPVSQRSRIRSSHGSGKTRVTIRAYKTRSSSGSAGLERCLTDRAERRGAADRRSTSYQTRRSRRERRDANPTPTARERGSLHRRVHQVELAPPT